MVIPGGTLAIQDRYFEPATVTVHVPHSPFLHFVGTFNPNLVHATSNGEPGSASILFPLATNGVFALNNTVAEDFLVGARKPRTQQTATSNKTSICSNILLDSDVSDSFKQTAVTDPPVRIDQRIKSSNLAP